MGGIRDRTTGAGGGEELILEEKEKNPPFARNKAATLGPRRFHDVKGVPPALGGRRSGVHSSW